MPVAGGGISLEGPSPSGGAGGWGADAAEDLASDASSVSFADGFVTVSTGSKRAAQMVGQRNQVNSDGVVSYEQGAGRGSVWAYHRHHNISYARSIDYQQHSHQNHRTLPVQQVAILAYTEPFVDSSNPTTFKKKLAHELTVHEIKEMTRARLAREAETPDPKDSLDTLSPKDIPSPFHYDSLSNSNCENMDTQFSFPPSTHHRHHPSHEILHQQRPNTLRSQDPNTAVNAPPLSSKFFNKEEPLTKDDAGSLLPFDHHQRTTSRYSPPSRRPSTRSPH